MENNKQRIPKIIHQIWIQGQEGLPKKYHEWQESFMKHNPSYFYKLWDDKSIRNLLKIYFPYLVQVYDNLPYIVQKADMGRYIVLYVYGGIYSDMDSECMRPLDKLLNNNFFCHKGNPIMIMNHIIGTIPNHPIMKTCLNMIKERYTIPKIPHFYIAYVTGTIMFRSAVNKYLNNNLNFYTDSPKLIGNNITEYGDEYFPTSVNHKENMKNVYIGHHSQCTDREYLKYINTKNVCIFVAALLIMLLFVFLNNKK